MKREQKKAETRLRIKEAALSLFAELGYENASIEQIAKQAGVAKGTFFNYFSSKEELICDLQGLFVIDQISKLTDNPGLLIPRMRLLLFQLVHDFPLGKPLARALFQAILGSPKALDAHNRMIGGLMEAIVPVVALGQQNGELRRDMPAEMIARLALQTYYGALFVWSMGGREEELSEQIAITFDLFFKGIAASS
ncbi:TetR/AcrR family transcriptional regulator [Paenibacillus humicola]|uniref:TetR/AcrR family transcriptional regulator n=1 Tax=Paenibacillus humicola TaxID=3110540 RepID=UPI00237AC621|nr:TetR/AcrR family transcriptional regulator [Paenibacillus humicola]